MVRKKGTPAQTKADNVNVRLDPKIRYGLELLARKQRRNLSSVVEWALQNAINSEENGLIEINMNGEPFNLLYQLWDTEESDRLYRMATFRSELLTFEEERLTKLIRESEIFSYLDTKVRKEYHPEMYHIKLCEKLREFYPVFKKIDAGELGKEHLPKSPKSKSLKNNK